MHTTTTDLDLIQRSIAGEAAARRELMARLGPVVGQRVQKVLGRGSRVASFDVHDLCQDVLVLLLERPERTIGLWDPDRGLSLERFVGLVAHRTATNILRNGRRSGWAEHPSDGAYMERESEEESPEGRLAALEEASLVLARVRDRLSPRGVALLEALFDSPDAVARVQRDFNMSAAALHSFRSRLRSLWRSTALDVNRVHSDCEAADQPQRIGEARERF